MQPLSREFYSRDPKIVAMELLGKILVRKLDEFQLKGKIVETEAYYGKEDPASRARKGKLPHCELMWSDPGKAFIYMVHGNWLLNVVAFPRGIPGAVLIRAIEPLEGIELMMKNRKSKDIKNLTNGPGKLTQALKITNKLNGIDLTSKQSELRIETNIAQEKIEIERSFRINVSQDMKEPLRFYIKNNPFVSKIF